MITNLGRHVIGAEGEVVTPHQARQLSTHVHLQVLEEVNVLKRKKKEKKKKACKVSVLAATVVGLFKDYQGRGRGPIHASPMTAQTRTKEKRNQKKKFM